MTGVAMHERGHVPEWGRACIQGHLCMYVCEVPKQLIWHLGHVGMTAVPLLPLTKSLAGGGISWTILEAETCMCPCV